MSTAIHIPWALQLLTRASNDSANGTASVTSFAEEIQCYNLPYGVLGFVSHVLTYYTIICLWYGRKPLWPFSRVSFSRFDLALGGIGLLVSTLLSIVTIIRCRETWQLLVIAVWKMSMSLLNGLTAVHVAILFILRKLKVKREARREASDATVVDEGKARVLDGRDEESVPGAKGKGESKEAERKPTPISVVVDPLKWVAWWIVLYIPGMLAGITGLMSIVVKSKLEHSGVRKLTAGFYAVVGAGGLVVVLIILYRVRSQGDLGVAGKARQIMIGGMVWIVGSFSILGVFYLDWVLGMLTDNLNGLPSGDNSALYWTYWVAKRLPMFSL